MAKSPLKIGTPINKEDYISRILKERNDYDKEGLYNDDEVKEMAGYVFDDYGFNDLTEETWEGENYTGYDEYRDHFLDNFGGLNYDRGKRGVKWSYPSGWDKFDVETKNDAIDYYLDGYYSQKKPDYAYAKALRNEVYKNIDDYYQKKHGRPYTGSDVDHWRERAIDLARQHPDNAYLQNIALIANDKNGVDHEDLIKEIINVFGFGNSKGRYY